MLTDTKAEPLTKCPAVSVVLTVFNRETYLREAIESVLCQTFGDFELLIVDDCSSDSSQAIANGYLSDSRVRTVFNSRNLGQFPNRNYGASLARGEFLKFHDSDDVMYPHCLEFMVNALAREPRAGFALTASRSWPGGPVPMLLNPEQAFLREFHGAGMFNGGPANALFRTAMFRDANGFEDVGAASDHLFWLRNCASHSVLLINADLFYYRRHSSQELTSSKAAASYATGDGLVWRFLADGKAPLHGEDLTRAKTNWLWITAKATFYDIRSGNYDLASLRLNAADIKLADWIRYFRRPHRNAEAGVPSHESSATA